MVSYRPLAAAQLQLLRLRATRYLLMAFHTAAQRLILIRRVCYRQVQYT